MITVISILGIAPCALAEGVPTIELDGSVVTVTNAPNNSTLIIAAYNNGILNDVQMTDGSGTITADVSQYLSKAERIKAFLWDMENIYPFGEPKEIVKEDTIKMKVQVGDKAFTATLEDNAAVAELVEMMKENPVTIQMNDYSGFEKVGPLGRSLTTSNVQTTTTAGDIVLYNGNQIVMFYGSNSWSYTRIGRIDDLTGWEDALGSGSVTVTFDIM